MFNKRMIGGHRHLIYMLYVYMIGEAAQITDNREKNENKTLNNAF